MIWIKRHPIWTWIIFVFAWGMLWGMFLGIKGANFDAFKFGTDIGMTAVVGSGLIWLILNVYRLVSKLIKKSPKQ